MPVAIRNLTRWPIFVPLNSGMNLRLSPNEVSRTVDDVDLKNNSKIEKLLGQRAIAFERRAKEAAEKRASRRQGEAAMPAHEGETHARVRAHKKR